MKGFIIAWFCFSVVVLVLTVVSLTTNRWMYDNSQPLSVGLFQICSKTSCSPSHERNVRFRGIVETTAAFLIISGLCSAVTIILLAIQGCQQRKELVYPAAFTGLLSCVFLLVSCAVFAETSRSYQLWGFSYILAWIAFGCSLIVLPLVGRLLHAKFCT